MLPSNTTKIRVGSELRRRNNTVEETRIISLFSCTDNAPDRPLRILIVEDDESARAALNRLVQSLGHRTYVAQNLRQPLDLAISENQLFDALLSDIGLPDGTGWELLLRLSGAGLRPWLAVAISGRRTAEDLERSRAAGFDRHLSKPVEIEILEAILREAAREAP